VTGSAAIRSLPQHVVDVIAAGEVVERPASVVKELVENSLDAGANRVDVHIEDGGKRLIRVEDDGRGMAAEDLSLAFAPHATSKIRDVDDLEAVATCGFRGEALASIGAVSEAVITSRLPGEDAALRVENKRGEVGAVAPAAGPEGTSVEIRALFSAIPARRKFLRAASTETSRIADALGRIALARPDVAFSLTVEGRSTFKAPAGETLRERTARVLGADRAASLLVVQSETGKVSVEGFLAPPEEAIRGRPPQILSINGRTVQDRTVSHAVRSALEGLVTIHRSTAWSLAVTLPPGEVDVNVHPAKSEVRFRRPSEVHAAVRHAVREAVLAGESTPSIPGQALERRDGIRDALEAYLGGVATKETQQELGFRPTGVSPSAAEPVHPPAAAPGMPAGPMPILQVRNSFLVFESGDGIAIVDQHALHERILLERLKERVQADKPGVQRLLVPEVLETGPADAARVADVSETLARAGLLMEPFGEGAVAVQGVPLPLAGRPVRALAEAVLDRLRGGSVPKDAEALLHGLLETMACRSAVKAGDPLPPEMRRALIEEAKGLDTAGHCAHGRPTELRIGFDELEKRFRRT
jgi:DNA mismatch repair protein MutL